MAEKLTVYVDGACRGNPGIGGWGVFITKATGDELSLFGGEMATTNNRMELTAAIEGLKICAEDDDIVIYTDSSYVKKGITEWIEGWKKKQWKGIKNVDLWKALDQISSQRQVTWKWIKGHAGHAGNEAADQLANQGADLVSAAGTNQARGDLVQKNSSQNSNNQKDNNQKNNSHQKDNDNDSHQEGNEEDWLEKDPLGLDLVFNQPEQQSAAMLTSVSDFDDILMPEPVKLMPEQAKSATKPDVNVENLIADDLQSAQQLATIQSSQVVLDSLQAVAKSETATMVELDEEKQLSTTSEDLDNDQQQIASTETSDQQLSQVNGVKFTAAKHQLSGPRQFILDTETTGFYYNNGDRVIEIGALEMVNRKLTGASLHVYINPEKDVGDSENIHGLSNAFLADKPVFLDIAQTVFDYLKGAEIIAHNASFDMNFLDAEFSRAGFSKLSEVCQVTDTLALAKKKHPGQKNSLDALAKRYMVTARDRTFHGALLDSEILADVYLAMTGGQVMLDIDSRDEPQIVGDTSLDKDKSVGMIVIKPSAAESAAHQQWLDWYQQQHDVPSLWLQKVTNED